MAITPSIISPYPLGIILYHKKVMLLGPLHNRLHIRRTTVEMYRYDSLGLRGNSPLDCLYIYIKGIRLYIYQHRSQSQKSDHLHRSGKGKVGRNYLITRLKP